MKRLLFVVAAGLAAVSNGAASAAPTHLTRAERRAINKTLDVIVVDGVRRENPIATYRYVTPEMRGAITRRQWAHGELPIYPYEARGKTFHGWYFDYRDGNTVGIDLILHSRHPRKVGAMLFHVDFQRRHGRWLLSNFMPAATYAPEGQSAHMLAVPDFSPGAASSAGNQARLGAAWMTVPLGILGASIAFLIGFLTYRWYSDRRAFRT